jgi:uncharacterized protein YdhG (YjbR/CyaY superfamily)
MPYSIDEYIEKAPDLQQATLRELRGLIREALPEANEEWGGLFPVYTIDGAWVAGFAHRASCCKLYIMRHEVLERFAGRLGKRVTGKSCIDYKPEPDLSVDELRGLAREMLCEVRAA